MVIPTSRLEVFSDGVIAIAITMLVMEMRIPEIENITAGTQWAIFNNTLPLFLVYLLSFVMLAITWLGHHGLYDLVKHVDTRLLWHNLHLLFWITIIPVSTYFLGKFPNLSISVAGYGFVLFMLTISFFLSRRYTLRHQLLVESKPPALKDAVYVTIQRKQVVGYLAAGIFLFSIPVSFLYRPLAYVSFTLPAIFYLLPPGVKDEIVLKLLERIGRRKKIKKKMNSRKNRVGSIRHHIRKTVVTVLTIICTAAVHAQTMRFFEFTLPVNSPWQDTSFIAATSDRAVIDSVMADLAKPFVQRRFINGKIDYGNSGYNHNAGHWFLWHFVPNQWLLTEASIEVCDGRPYSDVDADTAYWVGTVGRYCPWSGKPARELIDPSDVDELYNGDAITFGPNPASNQLQIFSNNPNSLSLTVYNTMGQALLTTIIKAQKQTIDVSSLSTGIYFLQTIRDNKIVTKKFIIAR